MTFLNQLVTDELLFGLGFVILKNSVVMKMIKFAICDDEPSMTEEISAGLSEYMDENQIMDYHISTFSDGDSLLDSDSDFDLIFLDIQMKQPDGIETARRLRQRGDQCLLVFVTVLKECVFDAFEVQAYDYLVKPLDERRFKKMMDRAIAFLMQKAADSIIIQRGNSCEVILLSQIVYCEVMGRKVYIHLWEGKIISYYERLENLERRVDGRFFRCHRSYLVNLNYVCGCSEGRIRLRQGGEIPVSRLREGDLRQALLRYMKVKKCSRDLSFR